MKLPLFDVMINSMEQVSAFSKPLSMSTFYTAPELVNDETSLAECGTAACILGYSALHPDAPETPTLPPDAEMVAVASELWTLLIEEIEQNFVFNRSKSKKLSEAIVGPYFACRRGAFYTVLRRHPGLEDLRLLLEHKHLNSDSSSEIALDFLKKLKAILVEHYAREVSE